MGSYDGAEISELIEIYIQFQIAVFIEGNDCDCTKMMD